MIDGYDEAPSCSSFTSGSFDIDIIFHVHCTKPVWCVTAREEAEARAQEEAERAKAEAERQAREQAEKEQAEVQQRAAEVAARQRAMAQEALKKRAREEPEVGPSDDRNNNVR